MSDFNKPTNPPAFPYFGHTGWSHSEGMTLRDYFAAKALPAIIADEVLKATLLEKVAREAYWYADEMLKAREQA